MERVVQCMLCGTGIGKITCFKCGRIVCQPCVDVATGLCKGCGKKT